MWVEACLEKEFKDKCVPEDGLAVSKSVYMCKSTHSLAHVSVSVGVCVLICTLCVRFVPQSAACGLFKEVGLRTFVCCLNVGSGLYCDLEALVCMCMCV